MNALNFLTLTGADWFLVGTVGLMTAVGVYYTLTWRHFK